MSTETKTYSVSNIKQLVDLNTDLVNFDVKFKVASHNGEPFHILVVDQTTLDNNPNLEYKHVKEGFITGNVRSDNGEYQNYFLVIKADGPCNCDIEITRQEIPKAQPQVQQHAPPMVKKSQQNWTKTVLIIGVIVASGFIFYWLSRKKESEPTIKVNFDSASVNNSPESPYPSPVPSHTSHTSPVNPILEKLKKLNLE